MYILSYIKNDVQTTSFVRIVKLFLKRGHNLCENYVYRKLMHFEYGQPDMTDKNYHCPRDESRSQVIISDTN